MNKLSIAVAGVVLAGVVGFGIGRNSIVNEKAKAYKMTPVSEEVFDNPVDAIVYPHEGVCEQTDEYTVYCELYEVEDDEVIYMPTFTEYNYDPYD